MAVPVAPSFLAGEVPTAAKFNLLRDSVNFLLNPPITKLTQTGTQQIPSGPQTAIVFNAESKDTEGAHSLTTNAQRVTPKTAGNYECVFGVALDANGNGQRIANIRRNGNEYVAEDRLPGHAVIPYVKTLTQTVYLNGTTDYVEGTLLQDSGVTLSTFTTGGVPTLTVRWVSA